MVIMAREYPAGTVGGGGGVRGVRVVNLSKVRPGSGRPVPNKGGGLKTTTGKPKTKVTAADAKTASGTMKQRPNEAGRARTTVKPTGTGLSAAEKARVRTRQPIDRTKTDPNVLRQTVEDRAKARNAQIRIDTNTKRPARPVVTNRIPIKRDINESRTTFADGKYRARPVLQNLKSPDRTGPQGTIESRTSQSPSSRGTNIERVMNRPTRSQKEADRRVAEGLKAINKAEKIKALRQKWQKAGPAQRMIIEKQAAILKNKGKGK
jgi:hypothetical protein